MEYKIVDPDFIFEFAPNIKETPETSSEKT
jgi:hypothetical protein